MIVGGGGDDDDVVVVVCSARFNALRYINTSKIAFGVGVCVCVCDYDGCGIHIIIYDSVREVGLTCVVVDCARSYIVRL